jgi:hypothetical protein
MTKGRRPKPEFNFGDIVRVAGYWPRLFEIDGIRTEHWQYKDESWVDTVYEVYDVLSSDWIECAEEDITLVAEADQAEEYLAANPPDYEVPVQDNPDWMTLLYGGDETMRKPSEPRKPTAREISAKEAEEKKATRKAHAAEIDNLLDLRNWAADMLAKTNNEEFGDRVMAIDAKLKELVDKD